MNISDLLNSIHHFDSASLSPVEIYSAQKPIFDNIHTAVSFGDVSISDGQSLKNMLDGIIKNKLFAFELNATNKVSYSQDVSIQDIFAQKLIKQWENTGERSDFVSPIYNMGVKGELTGSESMEFPRNLDNYKLISTEKGIVPVLRSVSNDDGLAGHDWVTFSFCVGTLDKSAYHLDHEGIGYLIESKLDQWLFEIFGFGLGKKREKGMHFYKHGYELQDNLGLVLYGHSSKRISIQINGTGCALARKDWQERLYDFLKNDSISPKLNRVDLAFDDFDGEHVSVDLADQWDDQELFWCGGRNPDISKLGNWKRINGKGRTFQVGNRTGGKFLRIYERGKKEGDSTSNWCRVEVEYKSTDRYIPLDVLLYPSQYFKGAYPALEQLANELGDYSTPSKPEIVKKQSQINWDKAIEITKHQFGKYIRQFRKVFDDSELLTMLSSSKDVAPKRLQFSQAVINQSIRLNKKIECVLDELPLFTQPHLVGSSIHAI